MKPIIIIIDNRCCFAYRKNPLNKSHSCSFCLTTKQVHYTVEDRNLCSRCLLKFYSDNKNYITDLK